MVVVSYFKINEMSLKKVIENLSKDEMEDIYQKEFAVCKKEYSCFKEAFKKNECFYCDGRLDDFKTDKVCLHWLLNPKGFRGKNFQAIYKKYDFFKIQTYLRWIANQEIMFRNINNLKSEKNKSKLVEITISYKNLEWSFSCSYIDFKGHINTKTDFPHYHFQMRLNGVVIIKYSKFHIPFSNHDEFILNGVIENSDIEIMFPFGEGMEEAMSLNEEKLLGGMSVANNEGEGVFHLQTLLVANKGESISGDVVRDLMKDSVASGETMASLLRGKFSNVAKNKIIISPGPDVVNVAKRTARNRGKKDYNI